ncbi:hypothetical protein FPV67DRAFT_1409842 [Lyophyllum atratum]|nr:hypothetical protein FPV67DRAFT_1409842 [Lyophyllum atratum]
MFYRGDDLAPSKDSLSNEHIPKGLARALNAEKVRAEWKIKKRKLEEGGEHTEGNKRRKVDEDGKSSKGKRRETQVTSKLMIKPGESIQHFNRRVEDDMRPLVKSAVQSSNAVARSAQKAEKEAKGKKSKPPKEGEGEAAKSVRKTSPTPAVVVDKHANRAKEFQTHSSSAPRRLNDIAQAPPEFKKLPRGAAAASARVSGGGKREGVLSMAQKQMMEKEREDAITRYRELRARQRQLGGKTDEGDR